MKKIVFAAFVAAFAFASQAAVVMWVLAPESAADWNGSSGFTGGTALLFEGATAPSFADGAWNLNGAKYVTSGTYDGDIGGWGDFNGTSYANATGGEGMNYSVVLVSESGVTDLAAFTGEGKYFYIGSATDSAYEVIDPTPGATVSGNIVSWEGSIIKADWTEAVGGSSGGVPEPTSGLLLLIGGSLLALRRKSK
jgi:hypothetical protein